MIPEAPISNSNPGASGDATPAPKTGAAPIGTELVSGGNGSEQPGVPGSIHSSAAPVDIADDTLIRIPGQDQPVRYGELYKRLQGDYTKKTQSVAQLEKQLKQQQSEWSQRRQNEELSLRNTAAALLAKQGQGGQQPAGSDFLSKLEAAPYLDGKTAAQILRTIQTEGFGNVVKAIQDRDTVMTAQNTRIVQLERIVQQLSGVHQQSGLDSRIMSTLKELDIPDEAADWAKEIYSAYEGDDLEEVFPQILQERWTQLENLQRRRNQAKVEASRRTPFLPGKGGNGTAAKPLQLRGDESAREMADTLWEQMQAGVKT